MNHEPIHIINNNKLYNWAVIGAGPAGIAAIGKLLDNGIQSNEIVWIDPTFNVGLLGNKWGSVWSNTKVKLFIDFLYACNSFEYSKCNEKYNIHTLNPEDTCQLYEIVLPLKWITNKLKEKITFYHGNIYKIENTLNGSILSINNNNDNDNNTNPIMENDQINARNVILATGSIPKEIKLENIEIIPLEDALQIDSLKLKLKHNNDNDIIGVFGSSHSAIMIIRDIIESTTLNVINFYRNELLYAQETEDGGIIYDNTGLKGKTASWAKDNINNINSPVYKRLERYKSTNDNIQLHFNKCKKVIYAIGFERNNDIEFIINNIKQDKQLTYNEQIGMINNSNNNIFGIGIAFPELAPDAIGNIESQVGLWKFMRYLTRVVPSWIENTRNK